MPTDHASADPTVRSAAALMGRRPAQPEEPPAAPTEAERVPGPAEADDTRAARALPEAGHTGAARTGPPAAALRTALAASCMPGAGHTRQTERRRAAARRNPEARRQLAKRWHQTDSCPLGSQNARGRRPQAHSHQREADCCSTRARAAERGPKGRDRVAAKREAQAAALRKPAGRLAEGRPRRTRERAVAAAEREGRHEQAEAQLLRPRDCRRTGKTCWWAGSRRRTACTRSCEKLPSSSYGAQTCASLAPGSIPVLLRHYAVKGGGMCSETIPAGTLRLI